MAWNGILLKGERLDHLNNLVQIGSFTIFIAFDTQEFLINSTVRLG